MVIKSEALKKETKLVENIDWGHGVGVSVSEPPFITANNDSKLEQGMVLVLHPTIIGPNEEILFSKDTVIVTEDGCKIIGWYKNWDQLYDAVVTF